MIEDTKVIDLTAGGSGGTSDYTDLENKPQINSTTLSGDKSSSDLGLQDALVSGTNIKTINSTSLLGEGDVTVQETLVSGTNIKTINNTSLLGSGDITISSGGTYTAGTGLLLTEGEFDILQEDYGVNLTPINTGATEVNGVYSSFSSSHYLYLDQGLNLSNSDEWEIVIKAKQKGTGTTQFYMFSVNVSSYEIAIYKGTTQQQLAATGNNKNLTLTDSNAFSDTDWRWYKYSRTISEGTATLTLTYSTDGVNWATGTSSTAAPSQISSTRIFFGVKSNATTPMTGSIDINGCYIKVNGQYWWNPAQSTYKPVAKATSSLYGLVKPDNSSIIATDGVISLPTTGFDATKTQTLKNVSGVIQWVDD